MARRIWWTDFPAPEYDTIDADRTIALLPIAAVEQHGPHLPVGVDTILCEGVCKAGAEKAAADVAVVVAPTLWCGMAEHHMAFGGTFTFDIPTYRAVLLAFLRSIERHGFQRVFIVNGHGGNIAALNAFLPDFARETSLKIRCTTYFELAASDLAPVLEDQTKVHHACEVETSLMMVLAPDTVKHDRLPEAFGGVAGSSTPDAWYAQPARFRSFKELTASGVNGDARRASREKGEKLLAVCADGLADTLRSATLWS